jgi:hypothetical protein
MSLAMVQSRAEQGISAQEVSVEVHLTGGLPRFSIVGYINPNLNSCCLHRDIN